MENLSPLFTKALVAFVVFEIFTKFFVKPLFGVNLRPEVLANNLIKSDNPNIGKIIHFLIGTIGYPLLWYALTMNFPTITTMNWIVRALIFGGITWFLALGIFSPMAGGAFMANFGPLTWASLTGHILYALPLTFLRFNFFN